MQSTITIAFVNLPKGPKGPGSVKDTEGNYWKCWKDQLGRFQEGGTYKVSYKSETYQGKESNTVTDVLEVSPPELKRATVAPAGNSKYGSTDLATAERIFVCGGFNSVMGNSSVDPRQVDQIALVNKLRSTWANTFGGKAQKDDDMNDEIPFN